MSLSRRQLPIHLYATVAASAILGALYVASPASAQEAPKSPATAGVVLEELVVTARRREENVQSVPLAITALSAEQLDRKVIRDGYDLQFVTPGLVSVGSSARGRTAQTNEIRGQTNADTFAPPGVVPYFADVPAFTEETTRTTYDLTSVQILKGPQGTLFGQNTNGGAILYVPAAPSDEFEGHVRARFGNYNARYVEGVLNLPLVPGKMALRLGANLERQNGFTKNISGPDLDNLDYETARIQLRVNPTDRFENTTMLTWQQNFSYGPAYVPFSLTPCGTGNIASCLYTDARIEDPDVLLGAGLVGSPQLRPATELFEQQEARGVRTVDLTIPPYQKYTIYSATNTSIFDLNENLTLKNVASFRTSRWNHRLDFDGLDLDLLTVRYFRNIEQLTEEFQVQGDYDSVVFAAGVYYSERTEGPFDRPSGMPTIDDFLNASNFGMQLAPFSVMSVQYIDTDHVSKAVFGQATFDLNKVLSGLKLTAGYRYSWDDLSVSQQTYQGFLPGTVVAAFAGITEPQTICGYSAQQAALSGGIIDLASCTLATSRKYSAPNWNISLDWTITPGTLVYLAHRHGYKTGGWNSTGNFAEAAAYGPEYIDDVEFGVKSDFEVAGIPVRLNVAAWYNWYEDRQIGGATVFPCAEGPPTCVGQSVIQNIGNIHLWGGEAEISIVPIENLTLTLGLAKFEGEYVSGELRRGAGNYVTLENLPYTTQPETQVQLAASYWAPLPNNLGDLTFDVNWAHRSSFNIALSPLDNPTILPELQLMNARAAWANIMGTQVEASVFVRNLTDETDDYIHGYQNGSFFGYQSYFYGPPRMYGLELTYRF